MGSKALVLVGVFGLTVVVLFVAFATLKPTPPSKIVMSTGPAGSAYAIFAEQYREFLAQDGIEVELRSSAGTFENLARLNDPDSGVSVSFITLGMPATAESADLESLGAIFFEPIWFFLRSSDVSLANLRSANDCQLVRPAA